jgi:ribosomal protein S18 acetylase RimI-like enzyme
MPRTIKKRNPVLFQDWGRRKPMELTSDQVEKRELLPAIMSEMEALSRIALESRFTSGWRSIAPVTRLIKQEYVCALLEDKVVTGLLVLCPHMSDSWDYISTIAVTSKRQRRQLGRKLIRWAWMRTAKDELRTSVHIHNKDAIAFFRKIGFTSYTPKPQTSTRVHLRMSRVRAIRKDAQ